MLYGLYCCSADIIHKKKLLNNNVLNCHEKLPNRGTDVIAIKTNGNSKQNMSVNKPCEKKLTLLRGT